MPRFDCTVYENFVVSSRVDLVLSFGSLSNPIWTQFLLHIMRV